MRRLLQIAQMHLFLENVVNISISFPHHMDKDDV